MGTFESYQDAKDFVWGLGIHDANEFQVCGDLWYFETKAGANVVRGALELARARDIDVRPMPNVVGLSMVWFREPTVEAEEVHKAIYQFFTKAAAYAGAGLVDVIEKSKGQWQAIFAKEYAYPFAHDWLIINPPTLTIHQTIHCQVVVTVDEYVMDDERAVVLGANIKKVLHTQYEEKLTEGSE